MQAEFETDNDCYMIGYMLNGGSSTNGPTYNIVDMRTLETLVVTTCTARELTPITRELNEKYAGCSAQALQDAVLDLLTQLHQGRSEKAATAPVEAPVEVPVAPVQTIPTIPTLPV